MTIQIAGGSIIGTDHAKAGQPGYTNNHDSFSWRKNDEILVAAVLDGCGSGKHSEVGSNIASQMLTQILFDEVKRITQYSSCVTLEKSFWNRIQTVLLSNLTVTAKSMGESISEIVNNYFLFTFVGVVVIHGTAYIFSFGDGVYIIDGEITELRPFPNDAPPYLMYNLTGSSLFESNPKMLDIQVNEILSPKSYSNILLGTDGVIDFISLEETYIPNQNNVVGPISQFWEEDKYTSNPDIIRRRLAIINRENISEGKIVGGLLHDDTTLIVIRKIDDVQQENKE